MLIRVKNQEPRARIFHKTHWPLDTISFSLLDGFRGRASKIEIVGTTKDFQRVSDSVGITGARFSAMGYKRENEIKEKEITASKDVKSRSSGWLAGLLCLAVVMVVCYLFFWIRRQRKIALLS